MEGDKQKYPRLEGPPQVPNFQYPPPTAYCVPATYLYPVQVLPVKHKEMVDDWLIDAPMPYDIRDQAFDEPSTSTRPPFPSKDSGAVVPERSPLVPVQTDDDNRQTAETPHVSSVPSSSIKASDITTLERLNISPSDQRVLPKKKAVFAPERSVVAVFPSAASEKVRVVRFQGEEKPWCTVYYYEMSHRVGNPFYAHASHFTIDGTAGSANERRMALSAQPTSKMAKSGAVRNQIGDGIKLTLKDGVVWLTAISDQAFFVQSSFRNQIQNEINGTVFRLQNKKPARDENRQWVAPEQATIKLFDRARFNYEFNALENLPRDQALELMHSFCTTRISFVKGFGEDYSRRLITDCPCWIEIQLMEPYEAFDNYLRTHNCGPDEIDSRS